MRSCAEALRLLALRSIFDDEAQDMSAFVVFNLRGVYQTIDESAGAWDERNYWKKAETLRERWRWSRVAADRLEALIRSGQWAAVPSVLVGLLSHFDGVTVSTLTRDADWWCGALQALLQADAPRG